MYKSVEPMIYTPKQSMLFNLCPHDKQNILCLLLSQSIFVSVKSFRRIMSNNFILNINANIMVFM